MRTIVDLPDDQVDALTDVCAREKISRAEAVRRAVARFLEGYRRETTDEAFGLWRDRGEDGLTYQDRLRDEWSR